MHESTIHAPPSRAAARAVAIAMLVWLAVAVAVAMLEVLTIERRMLVPLAILGTTAVLIAIHHRRGALWTVARVIDVRVPILFHGLRAFVGIGFLVLASRGELDPLFARVAGWGDIAVGTTAFVVALGGARPGPAWTRVRAAWNLFGLLDILVVLATAQYILFVSGHPETMAGLIGLPWALVPLVLVPLVLATHLRLVGRLRA
jgi:hypothetical protein